MLRVIASKGYKTSNIFFPQSFSFPKITLAEFNKPENED